MKTTRTRHNRRNDNSTLARSAAGTAWLWILAGVFAVASLVLLCDMAINWRRRQHMSRDAGAALLTVGSTVAIAACAWRLRKEANSRVKAETALRQATREQGRMTDLRSSTILNALQDGVALINQSRDVGFVNAAIKRDFGPINGRRCHEYFHGEPEPCPDCTFPAILAGHSACRERFSRRGGKHYDICSVPVAGLDGGVELLVSLHDLTSRKEMERRLRRSLREKDTRLREVHHRVKNNLQVISSILSLQATRQKDPSAESVLLECHGRVNAIGLLHTKLYSAGDPAEIDFHDYVSSLGTDLFQSFGVPDGTVKLAVASEGPSLSMDAAVSCGLIVSELLSNALKHAFGPERKGVVRVALRHDEPGGYTLIVSDNGKGLPERIDLSGAETLGLQLVDALIEQLGGRCRIRRDGGTEYQISFQGAANAVEGAGNAERENPGGRRRADRRQGYPDPFAKDEICGPRDGR